MSRGDGLFASYVPGRSVVHRAPLGLKFAGVLAAGVATALLPDWRAGAVLLAVVLACHALAGLGLRRLLATLRPVLPVLAVLFAFQWWSQDAGIAARLVLGICACYLAAGIVTGTTQAGVLVDGVVTMARPLRRWLDPEVVGIAVAVMFRSVPWIAGAFGEVQDAARARGLERNPRALVLPVVIHTVAYARTTGEALAARGLGDPAEDGPGASPTNGEAPG